MTLPMFATLETRLAAGTTRAFENIYLAFGAQKISGIMERNVEFFGEADMTSERRTRLLVTRANAVGFASGVELSADTDKYSTNEILAMERSTWVLDRVAADDGYTVTWWLKK